MPSPAQLEQVRRDLAILAKAAQRDLARIWASFGAGERVQIGRVLDAGWTSLVQHYGEAAAAIGADHFDEWARELGVHPRVVLAPGINEPRAIPRLGWALSTMDQQGNSMILIDELVKQPFRSTVQDSAWRSGAAWARVPTGESTCAFCNLLAGRGAVYHSEQIANLGYSGKKYHGDCDCTPVLVRSAHDYPEGYDPSALNEQYMQARHDAGTGDPKKILAAMRERFDTH